MEGSPYNPEQDIDRKKASAEIINSLLRESLPGQEITASPEHIGHVLVDSESKEQQSKRQLGHKELLAISQNIIVEGSSLRSIYESHLVGERGLRRLVEEFLQGNNMEKALRQEILEREIDFERDPAMRGHASSSSSDHSNPDVTLDGLLQKANATIGSSGEEAAFLKARAAYEAKQKSGGTSRRQLVDIAMVSTILLLAILVATLVITRK